MQTAGKRWVNPHLALLFWKREEGPALNPSVDPRDLSPADWGLRPVLEWKCLWCVCFWGCWPCEPLDLCEYRQGSLPVSPRWSSPRLEAGGDLKCTATQISDRAGVQQADNVANGRKPDLECWGGCYFYDLFLTLALVLLSWLCNTDRSTE